MHGGCTRPTVITPIQNHVDLDPDVNNPAITYTDEQALRRRGPLRLLARYTYSSLSAGITSWSMHIGQQAISSSLARGHYLADAPGRLCRAARVLDGPWVGASRHRDPQGGGRRLAGVCVRAESR